MLTVRAMGIASAVGAVVLGLAYMAAAGAPTQYLSINAGTLVFGLVALIAWTHWSRPAAELSGLVPLVIGLALLATALYGHSLEGTTRWVRLGPLALQPGLILTPLLVVLFSRNRNWLAILGVVISAAALALQPDRAIAGAMTVAIAALAITRPDRRFLLALVATSIAFAITLVRSDTLPVRAFVEEVLFTAFETHWLAGLAVWIGSIWLLIPAIVGRKDPENRAAYNVFGAVWLGLIVASLLGAYPTPLVGYGASSILGYALSLAALPGLVRQT